MKKSNSYLVATLTLGALLVALLGCAKAKSPVGAAAFQPFQGTWVNCTGGYQDTIVITGSTVVATQRVFTDNDCRVSVDRDNGRIYAAALESINGVVSYYETFYDGGTRHSLSLSGGVLWDTWPSGNRYDFRRP